MYYNYVNNFSNAGQSYNSSIKNPSHYNMHEKHHTRIFYSACNIETTRLSIDLLEEGYLLHIQGATT